MKTVCEVLRLTATQNIPQRGHRETEAGENRGSILEILELIASRDEIVKKRFEFGPKHAKYTHHSVQDALLQVMADIILEETRDEVTITSYFGIICDETKDLSKKEQISIVLCYFLTTQFQQPLSVLAAPPRQPASSINSTEEVSSI